MCHAHRARRDAPTLELFRVRFVWRGRATRVALVGDPAGGWTAEAGVPLALDAPLAAAAKSDADAEWRTELVLPRGDYAFKFVVDGVKWLVGPEHASAADRNGNVNNGVAAGAPGSGHAPVGGDEAAAWGASEHRLALVRGAAAKLAAALDDNTLLTPAQLETPAALRAAAAVVEAAAAAEAARVGAPPVTPQILR
jgi:hypothetical protein